jgi:hypothetical protein
LQQVSGDETKSHATPYEWYRKFKDGRTSIEDDPRSGRLSPSTDDDSIGRVGAVIRSSRRLTLWETADECVITVGSCRTILTEKLNMHRVAGASVAICQELLLRANDEEFFF